MQGFLHAVAPRLFDRVTKLQVELDEFRDQPADLANGNLYQPMAEGTGIGGGWKQSGGMPKSVRSMALAGAAAAPLVAGWLWLRLNHQHRHQWRVAGMHLRIA
jgi:hypothetical protein